MRRRRSLDSLSVRRIAWYGAERISVGAPNSLPKPVGEHLELQLADCSQDRLRFAEVGIAQHLHDTLLVELVEALAELLEAAVVERTGLGEHLGREPRDRRELDGQPCIAGVVQRVAQLHAAGVDETDDIAGERLVDRLAIGPERRRRVLRGDVAAGAMVGDAHATFELVPSRCGRTRSGRGATGPCWPGP